MAKTDEDLFIQCFMTDICSAPFEYDWYTHKAVLANAAKRAEVVAEFLTQYLDERKKEK